MVDVNLLYTPALTPTETEVNTLGIPLADGKAEELVDKLADALRDAEDESAIIRQCNGRGNGRHPF